MSQAAPLMRNLAERLIAHIARENKSSGTRSPAVFPVLERLRPPLAALVGSAGFAAILSRALVLASPDVTWLGAVRVKADGSFEAPADLEAQVAPEKIVEGRVALLARIFGLLAALIGENLTMQFIRDAWPTLSIEDLHLDYGGGNETEKRRNQAQTAEKYSEPTD